jgi:alkylation response protein AidB-like acyl-CoA dehydrogenase
MKTVVRSHQGAGTLVDAHGKLNDDLFRELGALGYWGLLIPKAYGGAEVRFDQFSRLITEMATVEPTVAGLASVHGCIGAVDPVRTFGTEPLKAKYLPKLASGERLSAFALTEPGAGSDLTALRTTAVREGNSYVINGEKLFITNAVYGRTIGLVCRLERSASPADTTWHAHSTPIVLIVDLPEGPTESFQLKQYGLYALRRAHNCGLVFHNFRVPVENLLTPPRGDGLTIAYHGLNLGRVALCANAAGAMRLMLANLLPWASYRHTYGTSIDRRELVQRRIGLLAGRIVACDALVRWCSRLIDEGHRGEMECIIAKIFGSESQKEAAIEWFMKTHGGRAFLQGHLFGDNVHEFLAPCIYEGEGEMLAMAFFKTLVKAHGKRYFEPIGRVLQAAGIKTPSLLNPSHVWQLRQPMFNYAKWLMTHPLRGERVDLSGIDRNFRSDVSFASGYLQRQGYVVSGAMRKHQLRLADRQCAIALLSNRIQNAVVMLCTALHADRATDEVTRHAAKVVCGELRRSLTGKLVSDHDLREVTQLGRRIVEGGWSELQGIESDRILMPYHR